MLRLAPVICAALIAGRGVQAAITCNISSNGFASAYVPANPGVNVTSTSFSMRCTRNLAGDASSQTYTVKVNNGLTPTGQSNQGASGANRVMYDNYTDGACLTQWRSNNTLGGTIALGAIGVPSSQNVTFWGCIPAAQTTAPAGTYTDTVTMTPSTGSAATFPVSIETPSSCSLSSPPSNLTFNYVAFQSTAASATSNFSATCTNLLPYGMALDASSSVLTGLAYTLSLSASSSVGSGVAQAYTVNGTMAAGQSGACATSACSATEARTLTITY